MVYFDNNADLHHFAPSAGDFDHSDRYPYIPAVENFDIYSQSNLAQTVGTQTFNYLTEGWEMLEQPGPIAGASTNVLVLDDYGKYRDHV